MSDRNYAWHEPPASLELLDADVDIWRASLDLSSESVCRCEQTLSVDEWQRAKRYQTVRGKHRFIVGRGVLRKILAVYLEVEPGDLQFSYGIHGKPVLAGPFVDARLKFNLAHAHDLALYMFTRGREAGIDLEYVRLVVGAEAMVARFFSHREQAVLESLPHIHRAHAFFVGWTCKEAFVKAIGKGLSMPLAQVEVSIEPNASTRLLDLGDGGRSGDRWSLRTLEPYHGYVAAFAINGQIRRLRYWQAPTFMEVKRAPLQRELQGHAAIRE